MAYGDIQILRKYCKFPGLRINGEWQHGWTPAYYNSVPEMIIGGDGLSHTRKHKTYYVARKDQAETLRAAGYTSVYAVGVPIIYLEKPCVARRANSLLIMPDHTLPERSIRSRDQEYADLLSKIVSRFSSVTLMIHKACRDSKRWKALEAMADEVLIGADPADPGSMKRIARVMSEHEFMTTNDFGSHVPYAAYFGCKVSVFGPRPKFEKRDAVSSVFYKNCPECLDLRAHIYTNRVAEREFEFLNISPDLAQTSEEWGAFQLGLQNKKSARELRKLLDWNCKSLFNSIACGLKRRLFRESKLLLNYILFFGFSGVFVYQKIRFAKSVNSGLMHFNLAGTQLALRNGTTDIDVFIQHFGRRELIDINFPKNVKIVLDLGANIGVSVAVFRKFFPDAKIIAVEMNKANYSLLKQATANDKKVELVNGAIWSDSRVIDEIDTGEGEWAYRVGEREHAGTIIGKVPAYTFNQLFGMHHLVRVDVCKMDIEGAEKEVLESSWRDIFKVTKLLIVEVHDWIPGCTETVDRILEEARVIFNLKISTSGEFTLIENQDL